MDAGDAVGGQPALEPSGARDFRRFSDGGFYRLRAGVSNEIRRLERIQAQKTLESDGKAFPTPAFVFDVGVCEME